MNRMLTLLGWRLVSRHRIRTALMCFAIALPVAVAVALSSLSTTAAITEAEARSMTMGSADGRLTELRHTDVHQVLGPEVRAIFDQTYAGMPFRSPAGRRVNAKGRALDLTDPMTAGMFTVREGRPERDPATVALSSGLASQLAVGPGDQVHVGPQEIALRVSSLIVFPRNTDDVFFVAASPIPVTGPAAEDIVGTRNWLYTGVVDPDRAASAGLALAQRRAVPVETTDSGSLQAISLGLAIGLLIECMLLVAAAITMVAHGETRTAGLLAAIGVQPRRQWSFLGHYVRLVTVLGVAAGTGIGLGSAYLLQGPLQNRAAADWGSFTPAWVATTTIVLLTMLAVLIAARAPHRRMRSASPLTLLHNTTPSGAVAASWHTWVYGVLLCLLGGAVLGLSILSPYWSAVLTLVWTPLLAAGAVILGLGWLRQWSRQPVLPAPPITGTALRHLLSSPTRTTLTVVAIAVIASVAGFAQMTSQMVLDSAIHNRSTPVIEGHVLIDTRRPLTGHEVARLGQGGATYQLVAPGPHQGVTVVTDLMQCVRDTVAFPRNQGADIGPCMTASQSKTLYPRVGVADAADVNTLTGVTLDSGARAAYDAGDLAVLTSVTGLPGPLTIAAYDVLDAHLTMTELGQVSTRTAPDASRYWQMPLVYLSARGAAKLSLEPGDPRYVVPIAEPSAARDALPLDVQGDAKIYANSDSPYLRPAQAMKTVVTLGASLTIAVIVATMMALWHSDLRRTREMLAAIGAPPWWLRQTSATLALLLSIAGTVPGLLFGVLGSWLFMNRSNIPMALTWTPLFTGAAAIGIAGLVGFSAMVKPQPGRR